MCTLKWGFARPWVGAAAVGPAAGNVVLTARAPLYDDLTAPVKEADGHRTVEGARSDVRFELGHRAILDALFVHKDDCSIET